MEETTLTERGLSMRNTPEDAARLERKFKSCQKVLTALGDPTRQHLICIMLQQSAAANASSSWRGKPIFPARLFLTICES